MVEQSELGCPRHLVVVIVLRSWANKIKELKERDWRTWKWLAIFLQRRKTWLILSLKDLRFDWLWEDLRLNLIWSWLTLGLNWNWSQRLETWQVFPFKDLRFYWRLEMSPRLKRLQPWTHLCDLRLDIDFKFLRLNLHSKDLRMTLRTLGTSYGLGYKWNQTGLYLRLGTWLKLILKDLRVTDSLLERLFELCQ